MLAILVDLALRRRAGPVVINLSTSRLVERVAARHGVPVVRTPVARRTWSRRSRRTARRWAGRERRAHLPGDPPCRDSFIGMALLLEELARRERTLADLDDALRGW